MRHHLKRPPTPQHTRQDATVLIVAHLYQLDTFGVSSTSISQRMVVGILDGVSCGPRSFTRNDFGSPANGTECAISAALHSGFSRSINSGSGLRFISVYLARISLANAKQPPTPAAHKAESRHAGSNPLRSAYRCAAALSLPVGCRPCGGSLALVAAAV